MYKSAHLSRIYYMCVMLFAVRTLARSHTRRNDKANRALMQTAHSPYYATFSYAITEFPWLITRKADHPPARPSNSATSGHGAFERWRATVSDASSERTIPTLCRVCVFLHFEMTGLREAIEGYPQTLIYVSSIKLPFNHRWISNVDYSKEQRAWASE